MEPEESQSTCLERIHQEHVSATLSRVALWRSFLFTSLSDSEQH